MIRKLFPGLMVLIVSCSSNTNHEKETGRNNLEKLNWLEGKWTGIIEESQYSETWTKVNDSLFSGSSFMLIHADTVFSEKLSIVDNNEGIFYVPVVSNQNNGLPVTFKLITGDDEEYIFENKTHDFPQRIVYRQVKPDSLFAKIEGIQNGKFREEYFRMKRVNE